MLRTRAAAPGTACRCGVAGASALASSSRGLDRDRARLRGRSTSRSTADARGRLNGERHIDQRRRRHEAPRSGAWSNSRGRSGRRPQYRALHGASLLAPSGSTAFNLSNGGPVLVRGLDAMAVTFIAPHFSMRRSSCRAEQNLTVKTQPSTSGRRSSSTGCASPRPGSEWGYLCNSGACSPRCRDGVLRPLPRDLRKL